MTTSTGVFTNCNNWTGWLVKGPADVQRRQRHQTISMGKQQNKLLIVGFATTRYDLDIPRKVKLTNSILLAKQRTNQKIETQLSRWANSDTGT
jgi:hypothetical protein